MDLRALTEAELLGEFGRRIRRMRLEANLSQRDLSGRAGVSERTLRSLERGEDVQLSTWIRVLRALGRLESLELLLPAPRQSPMEALRRARTGRGPRRRASAKRGTDRG